MDDEAEQIANMLVPELLDRAAANIDELIQSICRWEADDEVNTGQKLQQELHHFFNMRRVFAEHLSSSSSSEGPSKKEGKKKRRNNVNKKITSAWKSMKTVRGYFKRKGGKVQPAPYDEEAMESGRQSSSPPQEAASPTSVCSNKDISTAPDTDVIDQEPGEISTSSDEATMEENTSRRCQPQNDMVMEMDSTLGPSVRGEQPKSSQEASGAGEQLITLRIIFYNILRNFFKSLTGK